MTSARGQSSRTMLDREFPHQVLVPADSVQGHAFTQVFSFHEHAGVPIKNYSAREDDKWYLLYCFAERSNAIAFQMVFGGELFDRS